jgi:hypothetical protein
LVYMELSVTYMVCASQMQYLCCASDGARYMTSVSFSALTQAGCPDTSLRKSCVVCALLVAVGGGCVSTEAPGVSARAERTFSGVRVSERFVWESAAE